MTGMLEDDAYRAVSRYYYTDPVEVNLGILRDMRLRLDELWTRACQAQQQVAAE